MVRPAGTPSSPSPAKVGAWRETIVRRTTPALPRAAEPAEDPEQDGETG